MPFSAAKSSSFSAKRGDLVKLVLLHFHQPQALRRKLVGNSLHRAALARACVAIQQHIGGGLAGEQGAGIIHNSRALALIAGKLAQALRVGVGNGAQCAAVDGEHMRKRENTPSARRERAQHFLIPRRKVQLTDAPARRFFGEGDSAALGRAVKPGKRLQKIQLARQARVQLRRQLLPRRHVPHADVVAAQDGAQQAGAPIHIRFKQRRGERAQSLRDSGAIRQRRPQKRVRSIRLV